jgi:hypothetical protein
MILKKKEIVIIIISIILVFSFLLGWSVIKVVKGYKLKMDNPKQEIVKIEAFSFSGKVVKVDSRNKVLTVSVLDLQKELKVFVSLETKLTMVDYPFDPQNPPEGLAFNYTEKDIKISDFKVGDDVSVQSKENIFGKEEIKNVEYVNLYK